MVELHHVRKSFGDVKAVDDVSLSIESGEFITLLGPSGCGKTTLLRMISGFETPDGGNVLLNGEDVTHLPPYHRNVNQVFQSYALFPHLNVRENIAFGLKMQRLPRLETASRVDAVLSLVSLTGLESRKPSQLSGGQKQRVALARAIVCEPKVLLLDEPLSALDAKLRHAMQLELKSLQRRLGITFVFVTHDQEEALTMSDRIAVMNHGRIEQLGPSVQVYDRPTTPFVASFIGQANLLEAQVVDLTAGIVQIAGKIHLRIDPSQVIHGQSNVLLSIRPEKIHLHRVPPGRDNIFSAMIEEEIFKGAMRQLKLAIESGPTLTVLAPNASATHLPPQKGERVFCHLHRDDIVVVGSDRR